MVSNMKHKKYRKIYIEITNNCNLHCSFCSPVRKPRRIMTQEEYEEILNKIKDYTDYIYLHVKGEPLLHPQIIEFIKIAEKYQLKVNLTTNGILLPKYVEQLANCKNLNKINISLHCENDLPTYFEDVFQSVEKLPNSMTVIYRLWTLNNNKLDEKSTKIVERIKDYYQLSTEIVDKIKNENNIKISSTIYVDKDNEFVWPSITSNKSSGYCFALKTHIAILSDGTVIPCCLDSNGIIALGNIFETDLKDIIEGKRYQNLLKSLQDRKPCEELCQSCTFKEKWNKTDFS